MNKSIKLWAPEDRPREKLAKRGAQSLSNIELLAILINTGTHQNSALDISGYLMEKSKHNLLELGKLSFAELKKIKGIGEQKAITLMASLELGKRRQIEHGLERPVISNSADAFHLINPNFIDKSAEEFHVAYLNAGNRLVNIECISNGGLTATVVDCRIIFKKALEASGVTQLIVAHNHPSGNLKPSEADKRLTEKLKKGGDLLDLKLLDHLIVSSNRYFSFADEGLL